MYDRNTRKFSCRIQGNISALPISIQSLVHFCKNDEESYQLKPFVGLHAVLPIGTCRPLYSATTSGSSTASPRLGSPASRHVDEPALRPVHHDQTSLARRCCVSGSRTVVAISWLSFAATFVGMPGAFMIASQLSLSNGMPLSMKAGTSGNAGRVSFVHAIGVSRRSLGSAHLALHPHPLPKAPTRIDGPIRLM